MAEKRGTKDKFYIAATLSVTDPRRLIAKDEDIFGVFDRYGDIAQTGQNDQGLYYGGTRFLSSYELRMNSKKMLFLSSGVDENNIVLSVDLTNPDIYSDGTLLLTKDSIHVMRSRVLLEDAFFELLTIRNFGRRRIQFLLEIAAGSDFKDIFEIRGIRRSGRGKLFAPKYGRGELTLRYQGLDNVTRTTLIRTARPPDLVKGNSLFFNIDLKHEDRDSIDIRICCLNEEERVTDLWFTDAITKRRNKLESLNTNTAEVYTSNEQFNESVKRALSDINMMLTERDHEDYPYGGIPWFCCPFGRDGIITALECLWIKPRVAEGVLKYLSATQARDFDSSKAAEPGKILHESRKGEMAALHEIPFGLYYGSVDSTPLFLMLAGAYWRRTADSGLIAELWPAIKRAIEWIEKYGDPDGDGFLEYTPHEEGLRNQGWKDSQDSVFHQDGALATGPIALCEVQGYLYAAKMESASIARFMGDEKLARRLLKEAKLLRKKFNKDFWNEEIGAYVIALDGEKKPCRVLSSNAGQVLFSGIADPLKARKVAEALVSPRAFSGWGIRTIAEGEALYNPMSYHNGSVWPHDNAIIAAGFAAYELTQYFLKVFGGIFDASLFMEFNRLPELFCGFQRRSGAAPTLYPVACTPQTWAAGSLLYMIKSSLGMSFEAENDRIVFKNPVLPEFLPGIYLRNLMVSRDKSVDLHVSRYPEGVTVEILKKSRGVSVLTYK